MIKKHLGWAVVAAGLAAGSWASSARAVEFFMPVPNLGGRYEFKTEFVREDLSKDEVDFTFVAEGQTGLGLPAAHYTVLPGPSTDRFHPLLTDNRSRDFGGARSDAKYFLPGSGLVVMEGEPGLLAAEAAVEVGGDPTTSWELPLLTHDDAFQAGDTAYVLNLMKDGTTASQLSIFNLDGTPAQCRTQLLSPRGRVLQERTGIAVPSISGVRIADIMSPVGVGSASGINVAVTCDHAFYPIGAFPSQRLGDVRVHFPSADPPDPGARQTLLSNSGFRLTFNTSVQYFQLPLEEGRRYHSITIDFDTTAANPPNTAFYRGLLGMWRQDPTQRFGKTLFFGINERFDRSKLLVDLGTPFIEVMIKKAGVAFVGGRTYHFRIELNSDQHSFRQLVTTPAGAVLADMRAGLFNDDFRVKDGHTLEIGFGLPGIADGAYSPPYGWTFNNIVINGYK
jgi:hypothetical protein